MATTAAVVDTPKMGGLAQTSPSEQTAWTGGQPDHTWTSLSTSAPQDPETPHQLRPTHVGHAQKAYELRKTGLSAKFDDKQDFVRFVDKVWQHLKDTGMDSIAYLRDSEDPTRMVSVVKRHSRFSLEYTKTAARIQVAQYDRFDRLNDKAARMLLLDSLDVKLQTRIKLRTLDEDPFLLVWMHIATLVLSTSVDRFEDVKKRIKSRHPAQFSGQDMVALVGDFGADAEILSSAGQYDHALTLHMVKIFLLAGGDGNENFRHPIRDLKIRIVRALRVIAFKDKAAANAHMVQEQLTYMDVCQVAEELYRTQYDTGE